MGKRKDERERGRKMMMKRGVGRRNDRMKRKSEEEKKGKGNKWKKGREK